MITNAQLDNERASQTYQIQLLKDKLEDMEETYAQLQREYKEKCHDHDALKRQNDKLTEELRLTTGQLNERDTLIAEQGLTIVLIENEEGTDARRALVSVENAHLLGTVQGSLGKSLLHSLGSSIHFLSVSIYPYRCATQTLCRRKVRTSGGDQQTTATIERHQTPGTSRWFLKWAHGRRRVRGCSKYDQFIISFERFITKSQIISLKNLRRGKQITVRIQIQATEGGTGDR